MKILASAVPLNNYNIFTKLFFIQVISDGTPYRAAEVHFHKCRGGGFGMHCRFHGSAITSLGAYRDWKLFSKGFLTSVCHDDERPNDNARDMYRIHILTLQRHTLVSQITFCTIILPSEQVNEASPISNKYNRRRQWIERKPFAFILIDKSITFLYAHTHIFLHHFSVADGVEHNSIQHIHSRQL